MASRHPPHSSQPHAQYYYSDADAPHYSPHPNVQQYPAHLNVQHHDPSSESYPGAQPSPAVHVPPPYVAKITRPDAAVPPKYTHTWDEVQSDAEFFPAIFTENKGAFIRYLEASLVWKPRWFQDLELKPSGARKVLWPNVKYVSCHHISDDMHWSLRLLRYQLHVGQNTFKASAFAIMIVFEIIFVVLTPRPERWPNGLRTIESFTGVPSSYIENWFTDRRAANATNRLELDAETRCITQEVESGRGRKIQFPIRQDAWDYIASHVREMSWDSTSFRYCLDNLLQFLADDRLPKHCTYVLDRSYLHGIYVGPLGPEYGTQWSLDPQSDLTNKIQTSILSRDKYPSQINFSKKLRAPFSFLIPRNLQFRVFLFHNAGDVDNYMARCRTGMIFPPYANINVEAYQAERHG